MQHWSSKLFSHMLRATSQSRLFLTPQLKALLCLQSLNLRRVGNKRRAWGGGSREEQRGREGDGREGEGRERK